MPHLLIARVTRPSFFLLLEFGIAGFPFSPSDLLPGPPGGSGLETLISSR